MKTLTKYQILIIVLAAFVAVACTKETKVVQQQVPVKGQEDTTGGKGNPNQSSQFTGGPGRGSVDSEKEGVLSGGGSYGDESSNYLLEQASKDLAKRLRNVTQEVLVNLPEGWSLEKLASVIEQVKTSKGKSEKRNGVELMFNYGKDKDTGEPYIEALNLFYTSFASVPVNYLDSTQYWAYLKEIRLKLMHEAVHLMGVGIGEDNDGDARVLATKLVDALRNDIIACTSKEGIVEPWIRSFNDGALFRKDISCFKASTEDASKMKKEVIDGKVSLAFETEYGGSRIPVGPSYVSIYIDQASLNGALGDPRNYAFFYSVFGYDGINKTLEYDNSSPSYIAPPHPLEVERLTSDLNYFYARGGLDIVTDDPSVVVGINNIQVHKYNIQDKNVDRSQFPVISYSQKIESKSISIRHLGFKFSSSGSNGYNYTELSSISRQYEIPIKINEAAEVFTVDLEKSTATITVNQDVDVLCDEGPRKVRLDNLVIPMQCENRKIEAIDLNNYL